METICVVIGIQIHDNILAAQYKFCTNILLKTVIVSVRLSSVSVELGEPDNHW